jgi:copper resistance protein B
MPRFLLLVLLLLAFAPLARAQDDPPFPEYPAFRPSQGPAGDQMLYSLALVDLFEIAPAVGGVPARVDALYRIGNDYTRLYLRGEAEGLLAEGEGEAEFQALYSRLITSYFEAQVGVRTDLAFEGGPVRARPQLAVGLEGLAPYWFEVEPALFVSYRGDVSARLEASYDLLVTQRLVLQPETEVVFGLQEVDEWGIGSGLSSVELGLRLRYEIRREVAPYVGVEWTRAVTAEAEPGPDARIVFGVRLWR